MDVQQTIQRPFGVNVLGSCVARVKPDFATISFAVTRVAEKPADAFAAARKAVDAVRAFLGRSDVAPADVQGSPATLHHELRGLDAESTGRHEAVASFVVHLRDLDRLEAVLAGLVDAGVDQIDGVQPRTSKLADVRAQARARALQAARRKAEDYAAASSLELGRIVHIEDVDTAAMARFTPPALDVADDEDPPAPGAIEVAALVMVGFQIERDKPYKSGF